MTEKENICSFHRWRNQEKRQSIIPRATLKNNDKWDHTFHCYLEELSTESSEYWYYSENELNLVLFKFWFDVCTQRPPLSKEEKYQALQNNADPNPEHYSIASLRNLRNGLSRCLSGHGKTLI